MVKSWVESGNVLANFLLAPSIAVNGDIGIPVVQFEPFMKEISKALFGAFSESTSLVVMNS